MRTLIETPEPNDPSDFDLFVSASAAFAGDDPVTQIAVAHRLLTEAAGVLAAGEGPRFDGSLELADVCEKAIRELAC